MDIKRTNNVAVPLDHQTVSETENKKAFRKPDGVAQAAGASAPREAGGYTKADLKDPAKLEGIVNRYLGDFLENASLRVNVPVSEAGRAQLVQYLSTDPLIRGKLINYLQRVLE